MRNIKRVTLINFVIAASILAPFQCLAVWDGDTWINEYQTAEEARNAGSYGYNYVDGVYTYIDYPATNYSIIAGYSPQDVPINDSGYNAMLGYQGDAPQPETPAIMTGTEQYIPKFETPAFITEMETNTPKLETPAQITGLVSNFPQLEIAALVTGVVANVPQLETAAFMPNMDINTEISAKKESFIFKPISYDFSDIKLDNKVNLPNVEFLKEDFFPAYSYKAYEKEIEAAEIAKVNHANLDDSGFLTLRQIEYNRMDPRYADQIEQGIMNAAKANDINPNLLRALVNQESVFNPTVVSECGAKGLTQLMDETAKYLGVRNSFDIQDNLNGGAKYLRQELDEFGSIEFALSAYNAGPGATQAAIENHGGIPRIGETLAYVDKVTNNFKIYSLESPYILK